MSLHVVGKAPFQPRSIDTIILSTDKRLKDPRSATLAQQDLRTLRHPNLENHPDFIELKQRLEAYYEDRNLPLIRQKMLIHKSRNWREVLFNSLLDLLSELTFTEDREQQIQLLAKVKKWYEEKTTTISALPRAVQKLPQQTRTKAEILIDDRPEEVKGKTDSISKIVAQNSSPLKSAKLPSAEKLFYERPKLEPKLETTAADYDRSNKRFNELREREMNELRAIATRDGNT